jgi:hypothetical protein
VWGDIQLIVQFILLCKGRFVDFVNEKGDKVASNLFVHSYTSYGKPTPIQNISDLKKAVSRQYELLNNFMPEELTLVDTDGKEVNEARFSTLDWEKPVTLRVRGNFWKVFLKFSHYQSTHPTLVFSLRQEM